MSQRAGGWWPLGRGESDPMDAHRRSGTSDHAHVPDAFGAFGVACGRGAVTGSRWVRPRVQRRLALVLFLALLPTLSYFGHWPEATFTLPGSSLVLGLPGSLAHTHGGDREAGGDGHTSHCHADAASCSDAPLTAVSAFAVLTESVALLGAAGVLTLLALRWWQPASSQLLVPELRPPRWPA